MAKTTKATPVPKTWMIIPRSDGWQIIIFRDESPELWEMVDLLEADNRPYYLTDNVIECLGPSRASDKELAKEAKSLGKATKKTAKKKKKK